MSTFFIYWHNFAFIFRVNVYFKSNINKPIEAHRRYNPYEMKIRNLRSLAIKQYGNTRNYYRFIFWKAGLFIQRPEDNLRAFRSGGVIYLKFCFTYIFLIRSRGLHHIPYPLARTGPSSDGRVDFLRLSHENRNLHMSIQPEAAFSSDAICIVFIIGNERFRQFSKINGGSLTFCMLTIGCRKFWSSKLVRFTFSDRPVRRTPDKTETFGLTELYRSRYKKKYKSTEYLTFRIASYEFFVCTQKENDVIRISILRRER